MTGLVVDPALVAEWSAALDAVEVAANIGTDAAMEAALIPLLRVEERLHADLHKHNPRAWFNARRKA